MRATRACGAWCHKDGDLLILLSYLLTIHHVTSRHVTSRCSGAFPYSISSSNSEGKGSPKVPPVPPRLGYYILHRYPLLLLIADCSDQTT